VKETLVRWASHTVSIPSHVILPHLISEQPDSLLGGPLLYSITIAMNRFPLSFPHPPWRTSPVQVLSGARQMGGGREMRRLGSGGARPGKGHL